MRFHDAASLAFLVIFIVAICRGNYDFATWLIAGYVLYCLKSVTSVLLEIRQILFDQTALMAEDLEDDEGQFDHAPFPIETDD